MTTIVLPVLCTGELKIVDRDVKPQPKQTKLFYSKTGVYRGINIFLIFALKHRSWVLVRTALSEINPQSMF